MVIGLLYKKNVTDSGSLFEINFSRTPVNESLLTKLVKSIEEQCCIEDDGEIQQFLIEHPLNIGPGHIDHIVEVLGKA